MCTSDGGSGNASQQKLEGQGRERKRSYKQKLLRHLYPQNMFYMTSLLQQATQNTLRYKPICLTNRREVRLRRHSWTLILRLSPNSLPLTYFIILLHGIFDHIGYVTTMIDFMWVSNPSHSMHYLSHYVTILSELICQIFRCMDIIQRYHSRIS